MPTTIVWFRVGKADARMYKTLTSNAALVKRPEIISVINGAPVSTKRVVVAGHWEEIGTGEKLIVETMLKNSKGEVVSTSKAKNIIDKLENLALDQKDMEINKKAIEDYVLNPDGSIGDKVMPYPPTERFEVKESPGEVRETGEGYWVPSTFMQKFLIHEEYTLSSADPRHDVELYAEIEDALKRDEVILTTFSNGSYKLYYAFIVPYIDNGKFAWLLRISDKQVIYNALHDIPGPAAAIKQAKVLETLPPLAGLLTIPTRK
jgi:hypothetical protein